MLPHKLFHLPGRELIIHHEHKKIRSYLVTLLLSSTQQHTSLPLIEPQSDILFPTTTTDTFANHLETLLEDPDTSMNWKSG